ncbi:MAG TPA: hypothetical protein VMH83_02685 [Candidatus Acidoferrum sp.]|nr:hypothetical protein [Candidatus Acidoferrum sp.]
MQLTTSLPRLTGALLFAFTASTTLAQTADVPTSISGSYDMTLQLSSTTYPNFPYKQGDTIRFVIDGSNDTLCVNGTLLTSKPTGSANNDIFTWVSNTNTYYEVALSNGQVIEVNAMQGNSNNFAGQFTGSKVSSSTTCTAYSASTSTTPTITTDMQSVFDVAAQLYPTLFTNGSALGLYQGYTYKYFASSGIYVGVKDGNVFLLGGQFGNSITNEGSISSVLTYLQGVKTKQASTGGTTTGGTTTSLYKLTLTGSLKATVAGFSTTIPVNITLNDLPAPAVTDTASIVSQVQTSLGASGIANVKVTSINNTASRVTFSVTFSATLAAYGTVTYDLTYDYTK